MVSDFALGLYFIRKIVQKLFEIRLRITAYCWTWID